jgi:conjugative transfer signal peptidase TraF
MNLRCLDRLHSYPRVLHPRNSVRKGPWSTFVRSMPPHIKSRKPLIIIGVAASLVVAVRLVYPLIGPPLLFNTTDSEPHGVYWQEPVRNGAFRRGQLVVFPVPAPFRSLVYGRRWAPPGLPLIKGIGALEGDLVCINDSQATINGKFVGPVVSVDSAGQPLPRIRGCLTVSPGYFLPLSTHVPNSFDGRYMGQQPLSVIAGEVRPLWTF